MRQRLAGCGRTLLLALLLAGCGGGGGGSSVAIPAPPPAPAPAPTPAPAPATNFDTAEYRRSNGAVAANALPAYQAGASGAGVLAAVIDTGIATGSAEFVGRISGLSRDLVANRGIADPDGHGTSVSALLLAARDGVGIHGVAPGATLLALRADIPGSCATSDGCSYSSNAIAAGIDLAAGSGARLVNLSLGGGVATPAIQQAAARAQAQGVVKVIAAGNDAAAQIDPLAAGLLAAAPTTTIVVGAHTDQREIAGFSNRAGAAAASTLFALGSGVRSFDQNGTAFLYSGTSEAVPLVAGAVALLAEAFPGLGGAQIVDILLRSADDAGAPGTDPVWGRGILNIGRAFLPMGGTSLASGGTVSLDPMAVGSLGPAFGDLGPMGLALARVPVVDGYGRAFAADLGRGLRRAPAGRLGMALRAGGQMAAVREAGGVGMAFAASTGERRDWHGDRLTGADRLPGADAAGLSPMAGHVWLGTGSERLVMGFGRGTEVLLGLADGGGGAPALLVAASGPGGAGLAGQAVPQGGVAVAHKAGSWRLGLAAGGAMLPGTRFDRPARSQQVAARIGREWGAASVSALLALEQEQGSLLGARLGPVFGVSGARSIAGGLGAAVFSGRLRLAGEVRARRLWASGGGMLVERLEGLVATSGWAALSMDGALLGGDRLVLAVAAPERAGGAAWLRLGAEPVRTGLAPAGRERVVELGWELPGGLAVNGFVRAEPGHVPGPADLGAAVRLVRRY